MTQVIFELVEVTQQIKGAIVKNNQMGNIFNSKLNLPFVLFLCNFDQSDENNFSYKYIDFAIEGVSS